ncbi:MAG TPA: hypothetical protein IAB48_04535 [Candidatus Fimimorpha excrementavium]|nr:hypothetical protein [Candidatus Fimimorpha excrementavium]
MKGDMISAILFTMAGFLVWWQEGWWNGAFIFIAAGILYAAEGVLEILWDRGHFHGKTNVLGGLLCGIWLIAMALIGGMTGRLKGVSVGISLGLAFFFLGISIYRMTKRAK